jgi:hypothetical protein
MEALEPREGAMGVPVEREVMFIRVPEGEHLGPNANPLKVPIVRQHEEGYIVCIHGREIPDELAEEYLRQNPGAKFEEEG